ncbi:hypothetical protein N7468_005080 [Penicillium chermesinum]|uniref:Protein alcS n=1 Tax=Penicillium chermesinum TaxID=63820 RepID=A0A9W9NYI9_9EURO|nr:uncharacterized protein N7468_005080 [Penicillium chermesinum]KAJ5232124.1 hypothetical protein N7468_005080 [Penicillium chermesinum]
MSIEDLRIKSNGATMNGLTQVPTSVTLSAEQFERLYLNPMMHRRQPDLTKKFGNPTPLGLGAFVLTATPIACCLMGWRGATGVGAAFSGVLVLFGGVFLVFAGVMEFILGNTFSGAVFCHLGAFCLALGATLTPAFNAAAPYSADGTNTLQGLHSPEFLTTFAFFFVFMALLMFIYIICALRTNVVFVLIFTGLFLYFCLFAASWWHLAAGNLVVGNRCQVGSGAALFAASMLGFYLLAAQLFSSVGLPITLPVGDLTELWSRGTSRREASDLEVGEESGSK